jgi:plasmid stabilization system protein ParE
MARVGISRRFGKPIGEAACRNGFGARESVTLGVNLRQYVYHSHRIIFAIEKEASIVRILHVRHAARRAIGEPEE